MLTLLLGYLLLSVLFYVEYRYESSRTTTQLQTSGDDQGTTTLLLGVWIAALISSVLWPLLGLGNMDTTTVSGWLLTWMGLGWMVGGLILLRWAMQVNAFYLRAVATTDDQYICTDGPYKVIRHPGYLAFYLAWLGFGLASGNWMVLITILISMGYAYARRIRAEEQMMMEHFGVDYQQYANESSRIFPFIY